MSYIPNHLYSFSWSSSYPEVIAVLAFIVRSNFLTMAFKNLCDGALLLKISPYHHPAPLTVTATLAFLRLSNAFAHPFPSYLCSKRPFLAPLKMTYTQTSLPAVFVFPLPLFFSFLHHTHHELAFYYILICLLVHYLH